MISHKEHKETQGNEDETEIEAMIPVHIHVSTGATASAELKAESADREYDVVHSGAVELLPRRAPVNE